jgi:hypothetical protein
VFTGLSWPSSDKSALLLLGKAILKAGPQLTRADSAMGNPNFAVEGGEHHISCDAFALNKKIIGEQKDI